VVGSLLLLRNTVNVTTLSSLVGSDVYDVKRSLEALRSVIHPADPATSCVRVIHLPFRDFFLNHDRCTEPGFSINVKQIHGYLIEQCLALMNVLRKDITATKHPGCWATDTYDKVDDFLPKDVGYTCKHWVHHLMKCEITLDRLTLVCAFLERHLLHWFEATSLLQVVPECIHMLLNLDNLAKVFRLPSLETSSDKNYKVHDFDPLKQISRDANRFMLIFREMIIQAPLQTYLLVIFCPSSCTIRRYFFDGVPKWQKWRPKVEKTWGQKLSTLQGQRGFVLKTTFSPDGARLASGYMLGTVVLWNLNTGTIASI